MKKVNENFFDAKFSVNGTAIHSGISRNGILYTGEELKKARKTLQGVPFQKDHDSSVDKSIGLVTKSTYDETTEKIGYAGWIKEDGTNVIGKVKDGRVKAVSVGAMVERMVKEKEEDDHIIAKGIHFVELSVVSVPGVAGATIQQALKMHNEAKTLKEKNKVPAIYENISEFRKMEEIKMVEKEEEQPEEEEQEEEKEEEQPEEKKEQVVTVKLQIEKQKEEKMEEKIDDSKVELEAKEKEISAKEKALEEKEKAFEAKEAKMAEEEKAKLVENYKSLCEKKKVKAKEATEMSKEVLEALIGQLEEVEEPKEEEEESEEKEEEKEEEKKEETKTKGHVGESKDEEESGDTDMVIEKSSLGRGYSIFKQNYETGKYNRLSREEVN